MDVDVHVHVAYYLIPIIHVDQHFDQFCMLTV